jgi:hypothetical protein
LSLPAAITAGAASPATTAAAEPAVIFNALRRDTGRMLATGLPSPLNVISTSCLATFQTLQRTFEFRSVPAKRRLEQSRFRNQP